MNAEPKPPIALFAFRRPIHTRMALDALAANRGADTSTLFIYSDAARTEQDVEAVKEVRRELRKDRGFRKLEIIERTDNWGLARNIIAGVTEVIGEHGRAVVLEDDLVTSPSFLEYMNLALNTYADDERIFSVSGYNYPRTLLQVPADYSAPVFLSRRNSSWGWATWQGRWAKVDWDLSNIAGFRRDRAQQKAFNLGGADLSEMLIDQSEGRIDSWAIRFSYAHFAHRAWAVYPVSSLVHNIGLDGSGAHCGVTDRFDVEPHAGTFTDLPQRIEPDDRILASFTQVFARTPLQKTVNRLRRAGLLPKRKNRDNLA